MLVPAGNACEYVATATGVPVAQLVSESNKLEAPVELLNQESCPTAAAFKVFDTIDILTKTFMELYLRVIPGGSSHDKSIKESGDVWALSVSVQNVDKSPSIAFNGLATVINPEVVDRKEDRPKVFTIPICAPGPPSANPMLSGPPATGVMIEPRKNLVTPSKACSLFVVARCAAKASAAAAGAGGKSAGSSTMPLRSMAA